MKTSLTYDQLSREPSLTSSHTSVTVRCTPFRLYLMIHQTSNPSDSAVFNWLPVEGWSSSFPNRFIEEIFVKHRLQIAWVIIEQHKDQKTRLLLELIYCNDCILQKARGKNLNIWNFWSLCWQKRLGNFLELECYALIPRSSFVAEVPSFLRTE